MNNTLEFAHKKGWASLNEITVFEDEDNTWSYTGFVSTTTQGQSFCSKKKNYGSRDTALTSGLQWMLNHLSKLNGEMAISVCAMIKSELQKLKQSTLF